MKKIILDTHVFIWWLDDDPKLGPKASELIEDENNQVCVSVASVWEISIKRKAEKLNFEYDIGKIIVEQGFTLLDISAFHAELAGNLPEHHKDPFDRMIIAQAQAEGMEIMTKDRQFPAYNTRLIDATE